MPCVKTKDVLAFYRNEHRVKKQSFTKITISEPIFEQISNRTKKLKFKNLQSIHKRTKKGNKYNDISNLRYMPLSMELILEDNFLAD